MEPRQRRGSTLLVLLKKKDPDQMNDRDPRRRRRPIDDEAKSHAFVPVTTLTFAVGKKSAALPLCDKKKDPDQMNDRDPRRRRRPTLPPGVAVPSAQTGLTSLFGMVRGGPRRHGHLNFYPETSSGPDILIPP